MIPALLLCLALPARAEPFLDGLAAYEGKNFEQAAKLFQQSADEGNDYAQAYLAHILLLNDTPLKDEQKALQLHQDAAKADNLFGDFGLGVQYALGYGVAKDHDAAIRWYRKAAEDDGALGDCAAVNLGSELVGKDLHGDAEQLFKKAADHGGPCANLARHDLACLYGHDTGVGAADLKKVRQWLALSKDGTDKEALAVLKKDGSAPMNGCYGGYWAADPGWLPVGDKAFALFKKDAKGRHPSALYIVGAMYEEGEGARKNLKEALADYKKAAELGYAPAAKALERLGAPAAPAAAKELVVHSDVDEPKYKLPEREHDFALIVGVEKYKNIPAAQFASHDAAAFKAHAAALGVPDRNIVYLAGEAATRSKLQAYLQEWLPKNVKDDSTLYFYYSGHGAPDAETKQAYILPWDAEPQFLQSTALPLKDLYAELGALKARRVVVALDSCFSGAGGRSVIAPGLRPLVTKINLADDAGRLTVLSAASGEQVSGSLAEQGHGLFTYYLLKSLASAAKEPDPITPKSLYFYLKPRVEDAAARQNRIQTPQLAGPADEAIR